MMNRHQTEMQFDDRIKVFRVRIEDDLFTIPGTAEYRFQQFDMLRTIAEQPQVAACGPLDFQTMKMFHDGAKWVIELEARSST
jgi:hypothetical protein